MPLKPQLKLIAAVLASVPGGCTTTYQGILDFNSMVADATESREVLENSGASAREAPVSDSSPSVMGTEKGTTTEDGGKILVTTLVVVLAVAQLVQTTLLSQPYPTDAVQKINCQEKETAHAP